MNEPLIVLDHVSMNYQNLKAVDDVSFSIERGDFLVIAGENGSGKTTLVKGILGLHPIKSGSITYPGVTPDKIGYLPQVTQVQKDFPASVYEVVLSGYVNQLGKSFFYSKKQKQNAYRNMKLLEIESLKNTSFKDLSGGQKQRVLLTRALCATNDILFLDEPVASLDVTITKSFFELLSDLNKKHGITIVMITHDVVDIIEHSNKILRMSTTVDFYGSTSDYLERMKVMD